MTEVAFCADCGEQIAPFATHTCARPVSAENALEDIADALARIADVAERLYPPPEEREESTFSYPR